MNTPRPSSLSLGNWLALVLITISLHGISQRNFLLFHGLIELFSVVVAFAIFILAWNSRHILRANYLLFLGIAYLYVGGLDLVHTISYKGMGVVDHANANLASQLWIGARFGESLALLLGLFFVRHRLQPVACITLMGLACGLLLWSIGSGNFPPCFIEGEGVTPFNDSCEYGINAILLAALLGLRHYRQRFDEKVFSLLATAILFSLGSELAFTSYVHAFGLANLVGHSFKFISFYLIYKALIETGLKRPYSLLADKLQRNEFLLRQSEKEFRAMFELSAVGMAQLHPQTHALFRVNDKFCGITGYSAAELSRMTVDDLIHPAERERGTGLLAGATLNGQEDMSRDTRLVRKDGAIIWVRATCSLLRDEARPPQSAMAVITDITASRQAEQALRESEQRLKLIAASIKDVIWMRTPDHQETLFISNSYEEVWGRSCASLYERPWSFAEAIHPADRDRVLAASTHHSGDAWRYDYRIRRPDGTERWIGDSGSSIRDQEGRVSMVVGVARDITARKLVEEERRRHHAELEEKVAERTQALAERVEQVREMAMQLSAAENQERQRVAEILHGDLQQLLAAGTMQAERLLTKSDTLAQQTRHLEFVLDVLKKAHATVRSLSHDLSPPVLAHGGMQHILQWLADRTRERHGLEVHFTPAATFEVQSESLRGIIYRFVQELLYNVVKHAGVNQAWLTMEVRGGRECVAVQDHGCGFDACLPRGQGGAAATAPGIGLLSISERLRMLGGDMEIDSRPGQGSCLTLFLPPATS